MAKDPALLGLVRPYGGVFGDDPNKASFDLIASQSEVSGAALSEAVKRLADAPRVDAFSAAMKKRFEAPKVAATPVSAPGQSAAAPPAASGG